MKFTVTMKTPDVLDEPIRETCEAATSDEREQGYFESEIKEICNRWFEYGEYLTVEVDTDKKTCRVLEVGR
jgi:hypothetical protein